MLLWLKAMPILSWSDLVCMGSQLGYVPTTMPCVEYWQQLLVVALDLYESRSCLYRCIARIRAALPFVTDAVAYCALAESVGNVEDAIESLHESTYERELSYLCNTIDVLRAIEERFQGAKRLGSPRALSPVRFPSLSSPLKADPQAPEQTLAGKQLSVQLSPKRVILPSFEHKAKTKDSLRVTDILDAQYREHMLNSSNNLDAHEHRQSEQFVLLDGFRQANAALLSTQQPFGTSKLTT